MTPDLILLPVTWFLLGLGFGIPCGVWIAIIVWRYSRGWAARWMDLSEDPPRE